MLLTREIIATSLRVSMPGSVGVSGARDNPVEGPRDGGARDDFGEGPRRADRRAFQWRDRGLHSAGVVVVRGGAERDPAAARPVAGPCSPAETVSPWAALWWCGGAGGGAGLRPLADSSRAPACSPSWNGSGRYVASSAKRVVKHLSIPPRPSPGQTLTPCITFGLGTVPVQLAKKV